MKVCIVTPDYLSSSPRTVKEADALSAAGFDVRVVHTSGNIETARQNDERLVQGKRWTAEAVYWSPFHPKEAGLYRMTKVRHFLARSVPVFAAGLGRLAEYGECRAYGELARLVAAKRADLFIGHYPPGLAASASAAHKHRTRYGYDIEDLHAEEQQDNGAGRRKTRRVITIERRYLAGACHVTAVSDLVAAAIAARYSVPTPISVYNTFPLPDRAFVDGFIKDRRGERLSLYWFSQTVGEDRGLQDAIRACAKLDGTVQLHVRGALSEDVRTKLLKLADASGLKKGFYFHPPVHPDELLSRAVEHDIGLSLERPQTGSRRLSVTNKLFFYFLAGLAVAATDIPGQKFILKTCPEAGFLYPPGDIEALTGLLQRLKDSPDALRRMKRASYSAAETWNAEREMKKVIRSVEECLKR